jgi:hypothetical protein
MKGIRHLVRTNDRYLKLFAAACLLLMLGLTAGCGEDAFVCVSDDCVQPSDNTDTGTGGTTTTTSGVAIGNGTGAAFQVGVISVGSTTLISGASTTLSVSLVNADQTAYDISTSVNFSSSCASSTINPDPTGTSGGVANVSYVAGSCAGTDTITASATVEGTVLSATGSVTISVPAVNIAFGSGSTTTFVQGQLEFGTGDVGAGDNPLSAGGSTTITATLVDGDNGNILYTSFVGSVTFSSPCSGAGSATISSPVSVTNGFAQATYIANGCSGEDTVTANVVVDGNILSATGTITVAPASVGSIQFISADPEVIAIAGTGGGGLQETSTLTFAVLDNNGEPVPQQIVNFALDTTLGGIALSSASGVTGDNGEVTVIVQSGTIHTPVKVTATTTDVNSDISYSTQSDALVVSTGLADQDSFSLSISDCSPESYSIDGVTVSVNLYAADHFNNPVPDGTAISFTTEGGSIVGSCNTSGGTCSVTWTSQDPRPPVNGRSTILATAIGNESYYDDNSSGLYDAGDTAGADLPEAFRDDDEDGVRDAGSEEYLDFNEDGAYSSADGGWTGVACQTSSGNCAAATSLHVRELGIIIMATTGNVAVINGGAALPVLPASDAAPVGILIVVRGTTGQYPATGTNIVVETTNGAIAGTSSFTVPTDCSTDIGDGYALTVYMNGDDTPSTGILSVKMTSPSGIESPLAIVNVSD